jgi:hypothetical protein
MATKLLSLLAHEPKHFARESERRWTFNYFSRFSLCTVNIFWPFFLFFTRASLTVLGEPRNLITEIGFLLDSRLLRRSQNFHWELFTATENSPTRKFH